MALEMGPDAFSVWLTASGPAEEWYSEKDFADLAPGMLQGLDHEVASRGGLVGYAAVRVEGAIPANVKQQPVHVPGQIRSVEQLTPGRLVDRAQAEGVVERLAILAVGYRVRPFTMEPDVVEDAGYFTALAARAEGELTLVSFSLSDFAVTPYGPDEWNPTNYLIAVEPVEPEA